MEIEEREVKEEVSESEKRKRVFRNIIAYLLYNGTIIVFGLVLPRLYLLNFGSEVNGLVSTVKDIFAYLALLEAGVGFSTQFALYKPVATEDHDRISHILAATRFYYIKAGFIYTAITAVLAFGYPLVMDTGLNYFTVFIIIVLYGIPGIISFFIQGKYRPFLEVAGKTYVLTNVITVTLVIGNFLRLFLLLFTDNLLLIQSTYCVPTLIQVTFIAIYVKKKYPWINWKAKADKDALTQRGSVLVHQIAEVIFANTDSIIISMICGLKYASVYVVYMLFFSNFDKIVQSFTSSINFRLGQMFHTDKERFDNAYNLYEGAFYFLAFMFYTIIATFLLPVVTLYTSGLEDSANYISPLFIYLFTASTLLQTLKLPTTQIIIIAGKFEATRNHALIEMLLNIGVSIVSVLVLTNLYGGGVGVMGCIFGTIVAMLFRSNIMIWFTNKHILGGKNFRVYRRIIVNAVLTVAILFFAGLHMCDATNYVVILLKGLLNALWIAPVFIAVNFAMDWKTYKPALVSIRDFLKSKFVRKKS